MTGQIPLFSPPSQLTTGRYFVLVKKLGYCRELHNFILPLGIVKMGLGIVIDKGLFTAIKRDADLSFRIYEVIVVHVQCIRTLKRTSFP